jgi:peptidyl-tRNA hydrolase, PTH1 family
LDSKGIRIVAGLGNPGPRYSKTRHNAGFMLLDRLARELVAASGWKNWRGLGEWSLVETPSGRSLYLIKPSTFMNESGRMVADFAGFHKISFRALLVCFDDISIEAGKIRLRTAGSSGGQKGMQSVIDCFGAQNIPRLRLGIGPRPPQFPAVDYVLSNFSKEQVPLLEEGLRKASKAVLAAADQGMEAAMNAFNVSGGA